MGFRHRHVPELYNKAESHRNIDVVAACKEDSYTRETLFAARE
jgi:hypothetical protein